MFESEKKLLIACAQSRIQRTDCRLVKELLQKNLDWKFILKKARIHSLIPLLHKNLFDFRAKIPKIFWKEIDKITTTIAAHNLLIFSYSKELSKKFQNENISMVFLKGVSVAKNFEQDTLKAVGDIDLIVKKNEIKKIEKLLLELGWKKSLFYSEKKAERLKTDYELPPFFKGKAALDIHWKPMNFYEINEQELFETAEYFDLDGVKAKRLSPENQIIYLCTHSALKHGFEFAAKDLADLNETIAFFDKKINWALLLKKSGKIGATTIVFNSLFLARKLFCAKIPKTVLKKLKNSSSAAELFFLKQVNEKNLFDLKPKDSFFLKFFLSFLFQKTIIKKTWFLLHTLFPTHAHLTKVHKNMDLNVVFIYRLFNPFRLVFKVMRPNEKFK